MARPMRFRRGGIRLSSEGGTICCYKFLRSPLFLVLSLLAVMNLSSYFIQSIDDGTGIVATPPQNDVTIMLSNEQDTSINVQDTPNQPITTADHVNVNVNGLVIQSNIADHLKSLSKFPKVVHIIWPDKNILNSSFEMLEHGAKKLKRLNPDWEFLVHDYDDVHNTIQQFHHPDIPQSTLKDLENAHIVEKTDAFRLIRIYETGGLYVDIDRVMNVALSEVIGENTKLVIPTYYNINFAQDLFGSSPKNDLILNVFKRQCKLREQYPRRNGWIRSSDHMSLVHTFSKSMAKDLFGKNIDINSPIWDEARHVLNVNSNSMVVTKKDVWCDGLLIKDYDGCKSVSRESLYKAYNVTRWGNQVDAVWEKATE
eukprot:CAMPEP_0198138480 /NCGR_PEP_ID=MMETSP1443-20131203/1887_1 /TAXON_ID=186043 /ORGANISM="Entomoneis sp., Strain CCMP2396" /LENGTH=368 /DNA_ID=CAMNT_0043800271 /DNA_START=74 /DNA_END=1180 /DNA_ORIENTATION=+